MVQGEMNACNNACWALGLLVLKLDRATTLPLVMPAAERVVAILQQRGMVYQRMAENAAVTLGALATLDPATLAPHANLFLGEWYASLAQSFLFPIYFFPFFLTFLSIFPSISSI